MESGGKTPSRMKQQHLLLLAALVSIYLLLLLPSATNSLASSSSSSNAGSKKKPRSGGGGGFGSSATATSGFTPDISDTTMRLLDFLKAQKAEIANVAIGFKEGGGGGGGGGENGQRQQRGLFATKTFGKSGGGQILCKIPSDCALALSDPAQKGQDAPTMAHGGANLWNMYLSPNAAKRPMFAPYLDTLPTRDDMFATNSATPDFLSADELQLLEFPRIIQKAQERRENIEQVSRESNPNISFLDLQYATWLVSSRAWPLSISSDDETMAEFDERGQVLSKAQRCYIRVLVPLLDMVNHPESSNNANAKWTMIDPQKDAAWFALESTRPIAAGQEITIAYGSGVDSSVELYQNYGIVLPPHQPRHFIDTLMLKKGGNDCLTSLDDWTTTLHEDETMLNMLLSQENEDADSSATTANLKKILAFRIKLKQAYPAPTAAPDENE
jgi:SET domain